MLLLKDFCWKKNDFKQNISADDKTVCKITQHAKSLTFLVANQDMVCVQPHCNQRAESTDADGCT